MREEKEKEKEKEKKNLQTFFMARSLRCHIDL
jgi:hypothetical protein